MRKGLIFAFVAVITLAACSAADPNVSQQLDAASQRLTALETQLNTLAASPSSSGDQSASLTALQNDVNTLRSDIDALHAQVEEMMAAPEEAVDEHAAEHSADAFNIAVAQYFMDTAGFHGIDETLNETKTIDPAYLSTVNRVKKVLDQTTWPEELSEPAATLSDVLAQFAEALEADNADEAASLATQAHESQHGLSHAIDAWLGGGDSEHSH
jgi:hypothetical protein